MAYDMEYSLGLYEKAIPDGMSFTKMFEIAKECGFDRIEISIDESSDRQERLEWSSEKQRELGILSRAAETPIRTMCLSGMRKYPLGSHDSDLRKQSMEMVKKAVRFCYNANLSLIQVNGYDVYYEQTDDDTRKWFLENIRIATDFAARWGVVLAFETMETAFMDTVEKAMGVVQKVNSSWLGVYPDIGNLKNAALKYGTDVVEDLETGKGHIFAMHLKETNPGIYRDMIFGSGGHTEYDRCIQAALRMGVRVFTGEFWNHGEEDYQGTIRRANVFLRAKIEKAFQNLEREAAGNIAK